MIVRRPPTSRPVTTEVHRGARSHLITDQARKTGSLASLLRAEPMVTSSAQAARVEHKINCWLGSAAQHIESGAVISGIGVRRVAGPGPGRGARLLNPATHWSAPEVFRGLSGSLRYSRLMVFVLLGCLSLIMPLDPGHQVLEVG